jgi:heme/copper-type cytochrome/quinol oxidase subunit 1
LVAVVATLVVGLIPGLIAQAELAAPGLQVVPQDDPGLYNFIVSLHGAAWSLPLALAGIALSLLQASEAARLPMLRIVGALALAACPAVFVVIFFAGASGDWDLYDSLRDRMSTAAVVLLMANLTLAAVQQSTRLAVMIFTTLSLLGLGSALFLVIVLSSPGTDNYLRDTYVVLARDHAHGISIIFGNLAGVSAWIAKSRGIRPVLASVVSGITIAALAYMVLSATYVTGVMGMPLRYADYATQFADRQGSISLWSFLLAVSVVAGFAWLLSNLRHKPAPGPEAAFD